MRIRIRLVAFALLLAAVALPGAARAGDAAKADGIKVEVTGFRNDKGQLGCSLWPGPELLGVFIIVPLMRTVIFPGLNKPLGFLPFFKGPSYGVGFLTAGIVLAIMVIPYIISVSREVLLSGAARPTGSRAGAGLDALGIDVESGCSVRQDGHPRFGFSRAGACSR